MKLKFKIQRFKNKDVLATSCTCPEGCYHDYGNNHTDYENYDNLRKANLNPLYSHFKETDATGNDTLFSNDLRSVYNFKDQKIVGYCDEHGTIYKTPKGQTQ